MDTTSIFQQFNKSEFWEIILNGVSVTEFVAYFVLMALSAFIHFGIQVRDSVKSDPDTPEKFKFWFMLKDNILRILIILALIYVNIAFYVQITGHQMSGYEAILMGVSFDVIIGTGTKTSKSYGYLRRQREKLIQKYK